MYNPCPPCQPRRLCQLRAFNLPLPRCQPCMRIKKCRPHPHGPQCRSYQPCGGARICCVPTAKRCGLNECFTKAPPPAKVIYVPASNKVCCKPKKKCKPKCKPCCKCEPKCKPKCKPCCKCEKCSCCKPVCKAPNSNFVCKVETMMSKLRITIYKPPSPSKCKPLNCSSPEIRDCESDPCESELKICAPKKKKRKCTNSSKYNCNCRQKSITCPFQSTSTVCKPKKKKKRLASTCNCCKRIPTICESAPSICEPKKKKKNMQVSRSACNCCKNNISTCESIATVCKPQKKKRRSKISGTCCKCKTPLTITEVFKTKKKPKCVLSSSSSAIDEEDACEPFRLRCPQFRKQQDSTCSCKPMNNPKCNNKYAKASLWEVFQ